MKISKRKAMLIGLAATTLFGVKGCALNSQDDVYGPPQGFRGTYDADDNEAAGVYGPPPVIQVDENELEDVYGPPEWFDDGPDVEDNQENNVYGPPNWEEDEDDTVSENEAEDPGDDADNPDPEDNMQPLIYGPPEWFEDDTDGNN